MTTVERTIGDVAKSGVSPEIVEQAVKEAILRGLTEPERLVACASQASARVRALIARALSEAGA